MLAVLAALATVIYINEHTPAEQVGFSQFMESLLQGEIAEVILTDQANIRFKYEIGGPEYITSNPRRPTFKEDLLLQGVAVREAGPAFDWQLLLIVMLAAGAFVFLRRKTASSAMPLSLIEAAPKHNFADMAGNEEAKESVSDIVDFLRNPEKYTKYGARMPRGLVLHGMPGAGKTLMAKALAGEAGVPFFAVNGSDFVQMYVGVGAARVRELFKKARSAGKAVIFIDEIDALGKKRGAAIGGGNDERDQTLNALLTEMSGFSDNESIVVVAATNRLDTLDEALLRPGRFDRQIEIAMPDINARRQIISLHAANKPINADLDKWARGTAFFSGAMLEGLINEAAIIAAKGSHDQITDTDIEKAYYITLAGHEKKDKSGLRIQDRKITAYHEAGHALAAKLVSPDSTVAKVSIIPSASGVGGFCVNIPPEKMYYTKKEIEQQVIVHIAGRCAEELIFGPENVTTGASNDIKKATQAIKRYVSQYGMSNEMGLLDMEALCDDAAVIQVCKSLMEQLYNDALRLISNNMESLEAIAQALLEKEQLTEEELLVLLPAQSNALAACHRSGIHASKISYRTHYHKSC